MKKFKFDELARAYTGAHVIAYLLKPQMDESFQFCAGIIARDTEGRFSASRFIHAHLSMEELLETLENPGNMGV